MIPLSSRALVAALVAAGAGCTPSTPSPAPPPPGSATTAAANPPAGVASTHAAPPPPSPTSATTAAASPPAGVASTHGAPPPPSPTSATTAAANPPAGVSAAVPPPPRPSPPCGADVPCDEGYRVVLAGKRWDAGKYEVEIATKDQTSRIRVSVPAPGAKAPRCPRAVGDGAGPRLVVSCREGESIPSGMVVLPAMPGERPTSLTVRVTKDGAPFGSGTVTLPWIESHECHPVCVWAHTTLTL